MPLSARTLPPGRRLRKRGLDPKMPLLAGVVFNLRAPDTVRGGVRICRWSTISRSGGALTTSGAPIGSIEKFYRE